MDTDRPYRESAAAVLRQLDGVVSARDYEGEVRTEGAHDVEARLASGTTAAIEVTRLVDGPTLATFNELRKHSNSFALAATGTWEVLLGAEAPRVKDLVGELGAVATELERLGVDRADPLTWLFEPAEVNVSWPAVRSIFERMEPFGVLDFVKAEATGSCLRVQGPVHGGIASPTTLCAGIAARATAKAPEVRGRADEAWLYIWVDWTNILPGRVFRPDADTPLPVIQLPDGIERIVASVIAFDSSEDRLPVAQWMASKAPSRAWVERSHVDACFVPRQG